MVSVVETVTELLLKINKILIRNEVLFNWYSLFLYCLLIMIMVDFCSRNCNHFTSEFCQVRKVTLSKYDKNSISGSTLCPYNQTAFLVNAESKLMWRLSTWCGSIISNRLWSVTNFYISALPYPVNKQDIMYDCCPFSLFPSCI